LTEKLRRTFPRPLNGSPDGASLRLLALSRALCSSLCGGHQLDSASRNLFSGLQAG
jgi:hypothetical protein